MANTTCEVAVVGAAFMDLQVYPVNRTLLDVPSFPAEKMIWSVGGDAINESTIITRLGHSVKLVSCMGKDMVANMVLEHCKKNGINTSTIKQDPSKITSINIGLICEDGERTFINNRSGSIWTCAPQDIDINAISGSKILSFASIFNTPLLNEEFMISLFERAKAEGMIICSDIVSAKNGEKLENIQKALSYIDYFFPNYEEAKRLTGKEDREEIADLLISLGVKHVIMKIGKEGCFVKTAEEQYIVPGYIHDNCVDTTGAGDNFASGFICALLEGKSLRECAEYANVTASLAIEKVGATEGVKDREQVEERYQAYLKRWYSEK